MVLLVLLAGCTSATPTTSSTSGAGMTTSPSSPASEPSPSASPSVPASPPAPSPASQAQLESIVLHSTDLPAGWTATPHTADPGSDTANAEMAACIGVPNSETDKAFGADSDSFAAGDLNVSSSASSYKSQSDIASDTAMLSSPKVASCYERQVRKILAGILPAKATISAMSFKVTPGSAGGPANVVATLTGSATVSYNGRKTVFYPTMVFITGTLLEAEVDAMSIGTPAPADVMSALVTAVATRATAVAGSATV